MHIIIIGAGNVGYTLARALSQKHDVLVIEEDEKRFNYLTDSLDVGVLHGNGASPRVLEKVINENTKLFLAVTEMDEINIFACMNARRIKPDLETVARVRNPDYTDGTMNGVEFKDVEHIISPELLTAKKMMRIAMIENAVDYETIPDLNIEMVKFRIDWADRDIINRPIGEIQLPENTVIVAIHRGDGCVIIPNDDDVMLPEDRVTVLGHPEGVERFNEMLGAIHVHRNFMIIGGGIVGEHLLRMLEDKRVNVRLIEKDETRCHQLAKVFDRAIIINANGADPEVLRQEGMQDSDVLMCATDSEEENLLGCLIGKHLGVKKVISRYSRREYQKIFKMTGVESAIGYHHVVANEIIKRTVPEYRVLLLLDNFMEEFVGITVGKRSKLNGRKVTDLPLPEGSKLAMIVRGKEAILPKAEMYIEEGDLLLVFAYTSEVCKLEKVFARKIPSTP